MTASARPAGDPGECVSMGCGNRATQVGVYDDGDVHEEGVRYCDGCARLVGDVFTATTRVGDPGEWLAALERSVSVLKDDGDNGTLIDDALPRLIAAVRAALSCADQWQTSGARYDQLAEAARGRFDLASELVYGLTGTDLTEHAESLRSRIAEALSVPPAPEEKP